MAIRPLVSKQTTSHLPPTFTCHQKPSFHSQKTTQKIDLSNTSRRMGVITILGSLGLAKGTILGEEIAEGFEFKMAAPDQTLEEAESGVRGHAGELLRVKALIESEAWREAQKLLRQSSSLLKQDIYTIIQGKPGNERPQLRKLYSHLFNSVTKLDYAARDKDASRVGQYYDNIVVALDDILSRI